MSSSENSDRLTLFRKTLANVENGDDVADAVQAILAAGFDMDDLLAIERAVSDDLENALLRRAAVEAKLAMLYLAIGCSVPVDFVAEANAIKPGGPTAERVVAALLLIQHAKENVPVDEETVTRTLNPTHRPDFTDYKEVFAGAVGLLRTASYYILDARDCYDALASEPPEQETFPPLPFRRVWIEAHLPGQQKPTAYLRFGDPARREDGGELEVLGVGIIEIERSRTWDLYVAFRTRESRNGFFVGARITPGAPVMLDADEKVAPHAFRHIRDLAVGGAHLLTAKNVPHEQFVLPRHQRKRLRSTVAALPHMYFVNLASAGERDSRETGRQYNVRWLVRGHWRHLDAGQTICTCHRPGRVATWIEPYIKGPVGAPWKGRPVHRAIRQEASSA